MKKTATKRLLHLYLARRFCKSYGEFDGIIFSRLFYIFLSQERIFANSSWLKQAQSIRNILFPGVDIDLFVFHTIWKCWIDGGWK